MVYIVSFNVLRFIYIYSEFHVFNNGNAWTFDRSTISTYFFSTIPVLRNRLWQAVDSLITWNLTHRKIPISTRKTVYADKRYPVLCNYSEMRDTRHPCRMMAFIFWKFSVYEQYYYSWWCSATVQILRLMLSYTFSPLSIAYIHNWEGGAWKA